VAVADFLCTTITPVVEWAVAKLSKPDRTQEAERFFARAKNALQDNPELVASAPSELLPEGCAWAGLVKVRLLHAADNFSYKYAPFIRKSSIQISQFEPT
jgi:hypothetical protein